MERRAGGRIFKRRLGLLLVKGNKTSVNTELSITVISRCFFFYTIDFFKDSGKLSSSLTICGKERGTRQWAKLSKK